jgi:DNA-binding beta-propeller fold protein YncE
MNSFFFKMLSAAAILFSPPLLISAPEISLAAATLINKTGSFQGKIQYIDINGSKRRAPVNRLSTPQGIAFDSISMKIYWTDSGTNEIIRANLNGSERESIVPWAHQPKGIAVYNGKI